jgi:ABC-type amino acid transport substrate-binding protein
MDERLKARLRVVADPAEPRPEFVEQLHDTLAARLGLPVAKYPPTGVARSRPAGRPWLLLAATIALALALGAGALIAGAIVDRVTRQPSLLDELRSTGTMRVAVRPDQPQVIVPGGALAGFDIDVSRALGDRLGLRTELTVLSVDQVLTQPHNWDIALPSTSFPVGSASRFDSTASYYYWPFYLLVPIASAVGDSSDLAGETICAVAGSAGEGWLAPPIDRPPDSVMQAPTGVRIHSLEDDAACLADVAEGRSVAFVTSDLIAADLGSRPDYRIVGDRPAGWEARTIIVDGQGADAASLIAALNEAIDVLRADGELTRLSESRFGGQDVSVPPR